MSSMNDVLAASREFYSALNAMANGDAAAMAAAWATGDNVTAQHPIGGRDVGHDQVIASFARVAEIAVGGGIRLEDQVIDAGSGMAVETGTEIGTLVIAGRDATIHHRVTNAYRMEGDRWKLAHHHTDISPGLMEILEDLTEVA